MDNMKGQNRFIQTDAQKKRSRMNVCLMLSAVMVAFILVTTVGMPMNVLAAGATDPIETGKTIITDFIFSMQGFLTIVALLLLLVSGAVWFFSKSQKHTEAGKDWFFKILIGWAVIVLLPTIMNYINDNFLSGRASEALDGLK